MRERMKEVGRGPGGRFTLIYGWGAGCGCCRWLLLTLFLCLCLMAREVDGGASLSSAATSAAKAPQHSRSSKSSKTTDFPAAVSALVIGGNFTLHGEPTNLAQYDAASHTWYTRFQPQLYLYREAAGEVFDLVVSPDEPYDTLYLVGSFDTVCKTCQQLYCSVGYWTGDEFLKVGDGLCPRATDVAMKIHTALLTPSGSFFVGGTFQSRVWNGQKFVNIYNIAQYETQKDSWLPLSISNSTTLGGGLGCNWCTVTVLSLAWNERRQTLYIGGKFNMINSRYIEAGLAVWTKEAGIQAFPGGGLSYEKPTGDTSGMVYDAVATSLVYDDDSRRLFVAGTFELVNGQPCDSIAVWWDELEKWDCLREPRHSFSLITSLLYKGDMLYVAGIPSNISTWDHSRPDVYTVARMGQSSAVFGGKYQGWGSGSGGGGAHPEHKEDERGSGGAGTSSSNGAASGHVRQRSLSLHGSYRHLREEAEEAISSDVDSSGRSCVASGGTGPAASSSGCYRYYWEWLPGFDGVNASIHKLAAGTGMYSNSVFIGGAFSPPVLIWTEDPKTGPSTHPIGKEGELQGIVTSITQMELAPPDVAHDKDGRAVETPKSKTGALTWVVLVICIFLGICLGIGMAFTCYNQQYMNVPWLKDMVEGRNGISLTTLAGNYGLMGDMENEIRQRFDRAMQARHLWKGYNLNAINPKEIVLHRIIGEGSFGRVWSGMWRSSPVAVKEFVFAQAAIAGGSLQRNELIEEIVGEAAIMSFLRHPRILHLYGCSLTSQAIWIVSELCSKGSLRQVLDDRTINLSVVQRLHMALDIAEGMHHLHSREQPIIHRDLKSHNIFMQETADGWLLPKIGDWGSARAVALHTGGMRTMTHGVGTACWLAPEVIKHAKGSKQSDVYSYGIILWELATRMDVHPSLSAAQIIARVANEGLRPKLPRSCPWNHVMQACWHEDPDKRPDFAEVTRLLEEVLEKMGEEPAGGLHHAMGSALPPPMPSTSATSGSQTGSINGHGGSGVASRSGSREKHKRRSRTPTTPLTTALEVPSNLKGKGGSGSGSGSGKAKKNGSSGGGGEGSAPAGSTQSTSAEGGDGDHTTAPPPPTAHATTSSAAAAPTSGPTSGPARDRESRDRPPPSYKSIWPRRNNHK